MRKPFTSPAAIAGHLLMAVRILGASDEGPHEGQWNRQDDDGYASEKQDHQDGHDVGREQQHERDDAPSCCGDTTSTPMITPDLFGAWLPLQAMFALIGADARPEPNAQQHQDDAAADREADHINICDPSHKWAKCEHQTCQE